MFVHCEQTSQEISALLDRMSTHLEQHNCLTHAAARRKASGVQARASLLLRSLQAVLLLCVAVPQVPKERYPSSAAVITLGIHGCTKGKGPQGQASCGHWETEGNCCLIWASTYSIPANSRSCRHLVV